jgi:hypothetical protein
MVLIEIRKPHNQSFQLSFCPKSVDSIRISFPSRLCLKGAIIIFALIKNFVPSWQLLEKRLEGEGDEGGKAQVFLVE